MTNNSLNVDMSDKQSKQCRMPSASTTAKVPAKLQLQLSLLVDTTDVFTMLVLKKQFCTCATQ